MAGSEDFSTLNPTKRFSDRVADYAKYRPAYPDAAIDAILEGLGDPARLLAADIGAGTGISARLLASRGVRTIAIEPNADMRAAGASLSVPSLEWRDGTAEATGLPEDSVELVLCAQAFHWFRQGDAVAEFARILKRNGRLALMWNCRDRSDPLTRAYSEAIVCAGGESRIEMQTFDPRAFEYREWFSALTTRTFHHEQALDLRGLLGRALSASYVPKSGPAHERVMHALKDVFARHAGSDGLVRLKYRTEVHVATRAG